MSVIHWGSTVRLGNSRATAHVSTHDSGTVMLSIDSASTVSLMTHFSATEARKLAAELVIGAEAYEAHEASALTAVGGSK
jgi:hypothetical protein